MKSKFTIVFFLFAFSLVGCGSSVTAISTPSPAGASPVISMQPANATVPLAQSATFQVVATGSGVLHYQWNRNGDPIVGATTASYTTPPTAVTDSNSVFTVSVENTVGSTTSSPATLVIGPRSPRNGDLRFQLVDDQATVNGFGAGGGICGDIPGAGFCTAAGSFTTPLFISSETCGTTPPPPNFPLRNCVWFFEQFASTASKNELSSGALGDSIENFQNDLSGTGVDSLTIGPLDLPNIVVTSLTFSPVNDLFGLTWLQSRQSSGFDGVEHNVAVADFQDSANSEGERSRVVTAVSYNSGQVTYLSYGWSNDTSTVYETQVSMATIDTAANAAKSLAAAGYIITAFGGDVTNGILLVGTRVKGDSLPRPILVTDSFDAISQGGYAMVGIVESLDPTTSVLLFRNIIGER